MFFEDQEKEKKLYEALSRLKELLRSNSEVPEDEIRTGDYKVRNNWWHSLYEEIEYMEMEGLLNTELINKYETFKAAHIGKEFSIRRKTAADIEEAENMIEMILNYFE